MQLTRSPLLWMLFISLTVSAQERSGSSDSLSKIVEKNLAFPSPVEWKINGVEVSLTHVAWGPADSPEMQSKGRPKVAQEQPAFDPHRPYALALGFRAKSPRVTPTIGYTVSGLVRVKDTDGNIEAPMVLTPDGFVPFSGSPGVFDIHFEKGTTAEFWDVFPASSRESEFLFQVFSGDTETNDPEFAFRIVVRDGDLAIVDVSPQPRACPDFDSDFAGTIGASTRIIVHLAGHNDSLSGTEEYQSIGKTLWLRGSADSLGVIVLEERYPEGQITGVFKGKFSDRCESIRGYFSKPDGSRLLPFEIHQIRPSVP